jgi:hypothetical protein
MTASAVVDRVLPDDSKGTTSRETSVVMRWPTTHTWHFAQQRSEGYLECHADPQERYYDGYIRQYHTNISSPSIRNFRIAR